MHHLNGRSKTKLLENKGNHNKNKKDFKKLLVQIQFTFAVAKGSERGYLVKYSDIPSSFLYKQNEILKKKKKLNLNIHGRNNFLACGTS